MYASANKFAILVKSRRVHEFQHRRVIKSTVQRVMILLIHPQSIGMDTKWHHTLDNGCDKKTKAMLGLMLAHVSNMGAWHLYRYPQLPVWHILGNTFDKSRHKCNWFQLSINSGRLDGLGCGGCGGGVWEWWWWWGVGVVVGCGGGWGVWLWGVGGVWVGWGEQCTRAGTCKQFWTW